MHNKPAVSLEQPKKRSEAQFTTLRRAPHRTLAILIVKVRQNSTQTDVNTCFFGA